MTNIENAIEWYTGDDHIIVSLSQKKFINRVFYLAQNNDAVKIIAKNADGSIMAQLPINALHLMIYHSIPPRHRGVRDIPEGDDAS